MSARGIATPAGLAGLRLAGPTIVAAVLSSVYVVVAARQLGPAQFSDLAVCLSLLYVSLLFLGPLNLTLIRLSAAYQHSNDAAHIRFLLAQAIRLCAPWIAGAIAASLLLARPIASALNMDSAALVPWTGILAGLGIALGTVRAVALGLNEHGLYSRSVLLDAVVRVAAGGALVMIYGTAGGALAGFVIGNALALSVLGMQTWKLLPASQRPWSGSAEMSGVMTRALAFSAIVAGLQNVDMLAAKLRLAPAAAGDYAVALAVARGFLLLAAPFAAAALARRTEPPPATGTWSRILHEPLAAYLAVSAPALMALTVAPASILALLFGIPVAATAEILPVLSAAFMMAGAFLVLGHGEIRSGRFGFLVPAGFILVAELAILSLATISAMAIAWVVLAAQALSAGLVLIGPPLVARLRPFEGSAQYWEARYARGGASGDGSTGKFAQFKAEVLNDFVARRQVRSVIEFGCGDGQQLSLARYPSYLGFDVSPEAVRWCRDRFKGDDSKTFALLADYSGQRADLTLSLDVIYHLVEDAIFDRHMRLLFDASDRWSIVYASNHDDTDRAEAAHVRHRHFTGWVAANRPEWTLREHIPNRHPFTGDFRLGSFSDFFVFERS